MTKLKMTMDFDYLNYVTSTKLKKVNDKKVKLISHLILKISFLTLFGCAVKITLFYDTKWDKWKTEEEIASYIV